MHHDDVRKIIRKAALYSNQYVKRGRGGSGQAQCLQYVAEKILYFALSLLRYNFEDSNSSNYIPEE
jgi:hypothetical protein